MWRWQQQNQTEGCHWIIMKLPFPKQQKQVSGKNHSRQGKKMYVKVIGQSKRFFFSLLCFRASRLWLYWCLFIYKSKILEKFGNSWKLILVIFMRVSKEVDFLWKSKNSFFKKLRRIYFLRTRITGKIMWWLNIAWPYKLLKHLNFFLKQQVSWNSYILK